VAAPEFDLSDTGAAAFCPACGAGYTAGRLRCKDCDRELLPRSQIEAELARAGEAGEVLPPGEPETEWAGSEPPQFDLSDPDAVAYCPSCGSGYGAGPIRCVECDRELVARSWVEAQASAVTPEPASVEMPVPLGDVANFFKAHLLGSALKEEGIWFTSEPGAGGAVRFLVLARDLERASQVLADLDELEKAPPESPEES